MNKAIVAFLATLIYMVAGQAAFAGNAGDWYISPMYTFTDEDKDRLTGAGHGLRVGIGHVVSSKWAIEGVVHGDVFDGFVDLDQWGLGVDMLRMIDFNTERLKPYVVFGAEYLVTQIKSPSLQDPDNLAANVGIGAMYPLTDNVHLRSDLRYRRDFSDSQNFDDVQFNLGAVMPFGASAPAPVVAAPMDKDSDGDGVMDSKDRCPNTASATKVNAVGCMMKAAVDTDDDGVNDNNDRCPGTVSGAVVDANGCELDDDSDGVINRNDRCPNTRAGARVDVNGCEIRDRISLQGVNFETNSANLTADSLAVLDAAAATLNKNADLVVEVAGHTDSIGDDGYNLSLSQKRAEAVRQYLVGQNVSGANLSARGYGETEAVADNATAEGRRRNRRVELRILN